MVLSNDPLESISLVARAREAEREKKEVQNACKPNVLMQQAFILRYWMAASLNVVVMFSVLH